MNTPDYQGDSLLNFRFSKLMIGLFPAFWVFFPVKSGHAPHDMAGGFG
jgi:hypothetical protein